MKERNLCYDQVNVKNRKDILDLFNLLKLRTYFISHKDMPTWNQHVRFVKTNPYRMWFIVKQKDKPVGSFYIKLDNSIGINLIDDYSSSVIEILDYIKRNIKPAQAIPSVVPPFFYVNLSPLNTTLINQLENKNMQKIQISFKL